MMNIRTLKEINIDYQQVIVRLDLNVPIKNGKILDITRLQSILPTIYYLLNKNAKIILMSHLGRPKGKFNENLTLKPIAKKLSEMLQQKIIMLEECIGNKVKNEINKMKYKDIILLENLRFHPEEEKNDPKFAKKLSELADIYVNDAFGTLHRNHASIIGINDYIPSVCGFLIEKELYFLNKLLNKPQRPFMAIIGGAKISTKIALLEKLLDKVDILAIAGGMTYTFKKANGYDIGKSLVDLNYLEIAKKLILKAEKKNVHLIIAKDHIVTNKLDENSKTKIIKGNIPSNYIAGDIGPETIYELKKYLKKSKTIFWNGPLGIFEFNAFEKGTLSIANFISELKETNTIIGGGNVVAAAKKAGIVHKISHLSTGGGASIKFLEGQTLPGIKMLNKMNKISKTI